MSRERAGARERTRAREEAVEEQLRDVIAPGSPYWRDAVRAARARPGRPRGTAALAHVPPSGERDVCPDGDPAGAAALVVRTGERAWLGTAPGPRLRRELRRRLAARDAYAREVGSDTRPTSYVESGLAVPLLLASTRADLDLVARAGARLWRVLGLTAADVLVSALPTGPSPEAQALALAALASGAPAHAPGPAGVAAALRLLPATVLAAPAAEAAALLDALRRAGAPTGGLTTLLLVGAPTPAERRAAGEAAGPGVAVLAVHAPSGARVLWGECRESGRPGAEARAPEVGLHTYPDLDLVETVDPETGETVATADPARDAGPGGPAGPGELLLTQLGYRGSALVRWRTGDLVDAVAEDPCPACGRTVPRVVGTRRGALVPRLALPGGQRAVDLRGVTGALAGATGLADWRVVVRRSPRDGRDQLLVLVEPEAPPSPARAADAAGAAGEADADGRGVAAAVAVARDVWRTTGLLPTQVLVGPLPPPGPGRLGPRTERAPG